MDSHLSSLDQLAEVGSNVEGNRNEDAIFVKNATKLNIPNWVCAEKDRLSMDCNVLVPSMSVQPRRMGS